MSIAYLDPGNLESDLQAGATTGYQLLWVLFWATVIGLLCQLLAARLGVVTGKNLARVCREEMSRKTSLTLWVMTEIAIIGSDIQEVVGSAIAFKLLFDWPLYVGVLVTGLDTFTFLLLHYFGVRKLEGLFAFLIATMLVCFWVNFAQMDPSASAMAEGVLIPRVSSYAVLSAVSILGAVVMPHNIYLHSALVQSRKIERERPSVVREAIKYFSIEAAVALGISFVINLGVVSVFAQGFFDPTCALSGEALINGSCNDVGLRNAGDALKQVLGSSARYVWGIGLLAAGQSSTMTGTFAGQFVMEGFLDFQIAPWKRVLITRSVALVPAMFVAFIAQADPESTDRLGQWLNVLQSVQLPFAILPVLVFTSSKRVMGVHAISHSMRGVMWCLVVLVLGTNVYLIAKNALDDTNGIPKTPFAFVLLLCFTFAYFGFIFSLMYGEVKKFVNCVCGDTTMDTAEDYAEIDDTQINGSLGKDPHYSHSNVVA